MRSRFSRLLLLAGSVAVLLLAVGCNDTLRQFITPVPAPTGDPGTLAHAITVSTNPAANAVPAPVSTSGSDMHIDVSGDSAAGIVSVGLNPIFLGVSAGRAFVINNGDASNPPTVSVYPALSPLAVTVSTVTLPTTGPNAVLTPIAGGTSSTGNIYIANNGSNNVSVIGGGVLAVSATVPLPAGDTHPVMIAGNASNNKIFVVNQNSGSGNVTEISTIDNTVIKDIPVGSQPIWAVMSTDGLFVFVVNQGDGTVSVIDTSLDAIVACTVGPSCPSGNAIKVGLTGSPSPNFAFYDPTLKRVYVSNTGEGSISVINANNITASNPPAKVKDILVSGKPTSVTALANGTRAYAVLGNCPAGVNHITLPGTNTANNTSSCTGNLVSVIDTVGLQETGTIPVGSGAVSIASSSDSSRVFVISANDITTVRDDVHAPNCTDTTCLPGSPLPDRTFPTPSISIIKTSTNSVLATPVNPGVVNSPLPTFHLPQQDPNCVAAVDPNFNDDVVLPCPLQTPFQVVTFP
ncbi:MAG: YncE family protein [Candidatus Angelobacter sp.]